MIEREPQGIYPNYYPNPAWAEPKAKLTPFPKGEKGERGEKPKRPYDACAICKHLAGLLTVEQTWVPLELAHVCTLILKHGREALIPAELLFGPVKCGFFEEVQFDMDEEAPQQ